MNHSKKVDKYDWTIEELWKDIGDLDYDALVDLFRVLAIKFKEDAINDQKLGHPKVSKRLENISSWLVDLLKNEVQPLADVCRWYNEKKRKK